MPLSCCISGAGSFFPVIVPPSCPRKVAGCAGTDSAASGLAGWLGSGGGRLRAAHDATRAARTSPAPVLRSVRAAPERLGYTGPSAATSHGTLPSARWWPPDTETLAGLLIRLPHDPSASQRERAAGHRHAA